MTTNERLLSISHLDQLHTAGAGYDILRYVALPELLGKETKTILYFAGRNLARKFDITSMEDINYIFEKLGWGHLELIKEKKKEFIFHLMSDSVALRLQSSLDADFRLEAGFLAEAMQQVKDTTCECAEKINERIFRVEFTVIFNKQ